MVAAQKRTALNRRHMHAEEYSEALARRNAYWPGTPKAYREIPEGEDPHERLNELSTQEKRDCEDFRQGRMVVCEFTDRIQQEEKQEEDARRRAMGEEVEEDEETDFI